MISDPFPFAGVDVEGVEQSGTDDAESGADDGDGCGDTGDGDVSTAGEHGNGDG